MARETMSGGQSQVINSGGSAVSAIFASHNEALVTRYCQIWDASSVPSNGTAIGDNFSFPVATGEEFSLDADFFSQNEGGTMNTGITIVWSSDADTCVPVTVNSGIVTVIGQW